MSHTRQELRSRGSLYATWLLSVAVDMALLRMGRKDSALPVALVAMLGGHPTPKSNVSQNSG